MVKRRSPTWRVRRSFGAGDGAGVGGAGSDMFSWIGFWKIFSFLKWYWGEEEGEEEKVGEMRFSVHVVLL